MRLFLPVCAAAALATAAPATASGTEVRSAQALAEHAEALKPGDWVWAPRLAPKGPVLVYVDLDRQLASVYRNGIRMGVSTISSGKPGHETPNGVFTILEKNKEHYSRTYDNAPMPYQQRLTWKGVALHAGNLPGYPASHGCVRLPMEFAKLLFGTTEMGGTVVIAGRHGQPYKRPAAGVLAPARLGGAGAVELPLGDKQAFSWHPELSPSGPVSIIVSSGDQMVVILRNGVEIGRARADIREALTEAQVLTLAKPRHGRSEWIQVGVNDVAPEDAAIVSTRGIEQMHLPAAFVPLMRSVMTPGATVLITRASVSSQSTGMQTTVLASDGDETAN
ncbi:MAG TPA: L,D-transpeptidase family protein [Sphingomicrobium sp.]|nr:L,D-transpeptidase family protein [Sphingomicrobium sp.]